MIKNLSELRLELCKTLAPTGTVMSKNNVITITGKVKLDDTDFWEHKSMEVVSKYYSGKLLFDKKIINKTVETTNPELTKGVKHVDIEIQQIIRTITLV